jgi:uncharacterized membrane protein
MSRRPRAYARHDPRQSWARLLLAIMAGVITAFCIPARLGPALRAVAVWDAAALVMVLLVWTMIIPLPADQTRRKAAADDPGRGVVSALVLASSAIGLLATSVVLRQARTLAPHARDLFVVLCLLAVGAAWMLTHTAYTLRYAHLYYRDGTNTKGGGLTFPGDEPPSYLDFAYFAFTIGMCFQVSDVAVTNRRIRRATLSQAVLSFVYNTVIVAIALNVVLGLFG